MKENKIDEKSINLSWVLKALTCYRQQASQSRGENRKNRNKDVKKTNKVVLSQLNKP